jgi:hypothetical protein
MQRRFDRLTDPFAAAHSARGKTEPAAHAPQHGWERWMTESSSQLLGEQRTQDFMVVTFCAAFSLIGWLMIVQGADQVHRARQAAQWPSTRGTVESAEVYAVGGSEGAQWRPQVTYSYAVQGRLITTTRVSLGKARFFEDAQHAQAYAARYPARGKVTVFYNPVEVTESVLEIDTPPSVHAHLAFGVTLACLGPMLLALFGFPRYRRNRGAPALSA